MSEPKHGLRRYKSVKIVRAGEISEVVKTGCYVLNTDGTSILRLFPEGMLARYTPVPGDFWIVYADGYQSISPRHAFDEGYVELDLPDLDRAAS